MCAVYMEERWNTRKTLLQRVQDKDDKEAWDDFVFYYRDFLKMVLVKMNFNEQDSNDVIQEVLLKLWKKLPDFTTDGKAKFRTWLSRIIRNSAIDYLRKQKETEEISEEPEIANEPEVSKFIQEEWEVHIVALALKKIQPVFSEKAMLAFKMAMKNTPKKSR